MEKRWLVLGILASALVLGTGLLLAAGGLALARPPQAPDAEPSAVAPADLPWHFESVEETHFFGSFAVQERSLAVDGAGHLHLAYAGYTEGYLNYAYLDGTRWSYELVDTCGGDYIALAVEPAAPYTPHITFACWPNLMHAYRTPAGWVSEVVGAANSYPGYNAIALEPNAPYTPHIAYEYSEYASENRTFVQHAWLSGTAWLTETIGRGHSPSIAIAPGPPYTLHVAYVNIWDRAVIHAWLSGPVWLTETVTANASLGTALALEPTYPYTAHVVYFTEPALSMVGHAWQIAGGWNDELVDAAAAATAPALAIASTPPYTIHVSYGTGSYGELGYAWKSTDGWHLETVDTGDIDDTALVLVPTSDSPRIVYCNGESVLKQARQTAAGWDILALDGTGCAHPSMAREATAPYCPHVGYQDEWGSLKHAWIPRPVYMHLPLVVRRAP